MKIEIESKKLIKPSAPTVDHLRKLKISFIDQFQLPIYIGVIFFYSSKNDVHYPSFVPISERFRLLEKALRETLTLFYPLAGRYVEEKCLVECDDQGVEFLEAKADGTLDQFLHGETDPDDVLSHLATQPHQMDLIGSPLVVVQMTTFTCGGMAVGLHISHRIADMHTISSFLSTWMMACRGSIQKAIHPCFDLSSIFPPRDLPKLKPPVGQMIGAKNVMKRFVFDSQSIAKLKAVAKRGGFDSKKEPSRVELVTALLSIALLDVAKLKNGQSKPFLVAHMVNLRGRTDLLSHQNSCGNLYMPVLWKSAVEVKRHGLHGLVALMRDAITISLAKLANAIDKEDLDEIMMHLMREFQEELQKGDADVLLFTSWCRFLLHRVDLGWGEPEFVSSLCSPFDLVTLMDHKEGDDDGGVVAQVSLTEDDMDLFCKQHDILQYASHKWRA
ncbi:acetyl-CoA-benzylalcohol acetyltransferase-like [Rhodamnia argentea]|uniref:Acetyl-CoA-benzylalcohol acetyltransferase-like n=1 Tax=Rhodamnia argentea TaxID=178133 RepID=A0A8B8N4H1_9MYRT|nr:acetyl-CoA-benzylalcohol acetyltransferase-like [Rhodamnia argentea]